MAYIKAIETHYNGYRFRSRLEARWAVFFDAAGIPYEYEPEGFHLPNNEMYLPDFYLPWFKMYVEIKPNHLDEEELSTLKNKLYVFHDSYNRKHKNGKICIGLFIGDPMDEQIFVCCDYHIGKKHDGHSLYEKNWARLETGWFCGEFLEGAWCKEYIDDPNYDLAGRSKHFISISLFPLSSVYPDEVKYVTFHSGNCLDDGNRITSYRSDLSYYREKGRQARFEHGECG